MRVGVRAKNASVSGFCVSALLSGGFFGRSYFGDGPNTVSETTVQRTSSVSSFALTEFRGENSVSSSQPIICVTMRTHRVHPEILWGSVSSLLRNSTLETVFRPFPNIRCRRLPGKLPGKVGVLAGVPGPVAEVAGRTALARSSREWEGV